MDIKKSEFTISAATVSQCPKDTKPEFAFIGRSNVGKSSLNNMVLAIIHISEEKRLGKIR